MDDPTPKDVTVLPATIIPVSPVDDIAQTQLVLMNKAADPQAVAAEGGGNPDKAAAVDAEKKEVVPSVSYWQLFSQADRLDYCLVIVGTVAAMANGCAWPVFAILFASFTNSFGGADSDPDFGNQFTDIALQFVYLAIATFVVSYLQAAAWMWTGNRQTSRLRLLYLAAVLRQDISYFDTQGTAGSLLQGLNDDSSSVQAAMSEKAGHFIQHMTTFIAGIVVAFWRGWDMTLVMVGCMPFLAGIGVVFSKMSTYISTKSTEAYSKASSIAQQSISQVRTVAAYNREQKSVDDYTEALELPLQVGLRQAVVTGLSLGGINSIIYFTYALAFYYGAWRVSVGAYDGGDVLNVLVAALLGGFSLGQAAPVLQVFSRGQAAGGSIFAVVNRAPIIPTDDPEGRKLEQVEGRLELRNIAFTYPARLDAPIFTDFSLSIPSGKTVALVGSSGSGKSTIVQLIERFYDPMSGVVLLDDVDLRQLNLTWLRQQIGMVSQEPTLFATDIYENIKMGKSDATWEEVEEAARSANAYNFITSLPKGFQTPVGERGLQLSGGQKQRIAIARAILKNPKVLLLDEATSALDTESERIVQDALNRIIVGRTTVVVAHRLSTVQDADVIAVLRQGALVEMGSHKELIVKQDGAYATLVHLQMQEEQRAQEEPADEDGMAPGKGMAALQEEVEGDPKLSLSGDNATRKASGGLAKSLVSGLLPRRSNEKLSNKGSNELGEVLVEDGAADTPAPANGHKFSIEAQKAVAKHGGHLEAAPSAGKEVAEPADVKKEKVDVPLSRLVKINRPEWGYGFLGAAASAVNGVTQPAFAFVISGIIIVLYDTDLSAIMHQASFWSWMFFVIGVAVLIATILQQWSFGVMGQHLARRVRIMLFTSILRQEIGFFDLEENGSGILTSRLATDATYVRGMVGDTVGLMLQNLTCLGAGYAIAFAYDWRMALVVTGALPFLVMGMVLYYKFTMGFDSGSNELYALANQSVSEAFSSIRVVQAYNLQTYVVTLYTKLLSSTESVMSQRANLTGLLMGYSNFSIFAVYGLVVWFGGLEVSSGRASFEDMLKAFLAILLAAMGIAQAQIGFPDIGKAKAAVLSIFPLIDRVSKIDPCDPIGEKPKEMEGAIELRDIRFIYPARPTVVVFRKFSIKIPAGQTVALVGESGSGKSTIVGLIERFYDPQEGAVYLDGQDLRQLNVAWLRQRVGLVSQEPLLFSSSILENIRYGRPDATLEEIMDAARSANAYDFITALPDGFDTHVGEKGMQLSGGQKQRVAIARAMVKQPKVLLLDEATSALDSQSEQVVQAALDKIMVGRTSIVVAHRLSTVRNAHAIALVYRGSILEQGSHDELMAIPDGGYAKLVAAQGGNRGGSTTNLQAMASRGRTASHRQAVPDPAKLDDAQGSH